MQLKYNRRLSLESFLLLQGSSYRLIFTNAVSVKFLYSIQKKKKKEAFPSAYCRFILRKCPANCRPLKGLHSIRSTTNIIVFLHMIVHLITKVNKGGPLVFQRQSVILLFHFVFSELHTTVTTKTGDSSTHEEHVTSNPTTETATEEPNTGIVSKKHFGLLHEKEYPFSLSLVNSSFLYCKHLVATIFIDISRWKFCFV